MKVLDRYILRKVLTAFVFVVFVLVLVIVVIDMTEKIDKFGTNNLGFREVFGYYLNFIPWLANLITPITTFIAVVFVTARLAGHSEIIAILSSGMSFRRLMIPYLIAATLIGGVSFYLTGWIIPKANKSRIAFEVQYLKKKYYFDERNFHIQVGPDSYLFIGSYNNQSDVGYRFTLEKFQGKELKEKLTSRRIEWVEEETNWRLRDWEHRVMLAGGEEYSKGNVMDTSLIIHPREFSGNYKLYESMTIPELNRYIAELESRGATGQEVYEVEKYIRFTSPFTVLILTFMGVIVSARKTRGGAGFQIALGFLLAFIYIIFFILTKSIAEVGDMHPLLAVWIPNIIFTFIGIGMYNWVPR